MNSNKFSILKADSVMTEDETIPIIELDVYLAKKDVWKDMAKAFRDRDIIPNIANTHFMEA